MAILHVIPAVALIRPRLLYSLYGVDPGGVVYALLHHRAALFLVLVIVCVWAAIDARVRRLACVAMATSIVSFLAIYWQAGAPPLLRNIAVADVSCLPILVAAAWLAWGKRELGR